MNILKQSYIKLQNLKYSEENIAELFSIANEVIRFLESKDPNEETNKALHFILLTKEKEFQYFEDKTRDDLDEKFEEAKSNLMSDLLHYCNKYWDPDQDSWNN